MNRNFPHQFPGNMGGVRPFPQHYPIPGVYTHQFPQFPNFPAASAGFAQNVEDGLPSVSSTGGGGGFSPNVDVDATAYLLDQDFLKFQNFNPYLIFQTLFAYFFVFGSAKMFKAGIKPYKRGFFCDDQSISYPFQQSTVPAPIVYLIGYSTNLITLLLVEWVLIYLFWRAPKGASWARRLVYKTSYFFFSLIGSGMSFLFGGVASMVITDLGKFTIGRLRPHFFEVCRPDWESVNCSSGFILHDVCTGDPAAVRDARLSFPSGHSSLAFYCAIFFILYLHKRALHVPAAKTVVPVISLVALVFALFTALSRISDNKHHPTDVLAGCFVGSISAVYANWLVPRFRKEATQTPPPPSSSKQGKSVLETDERNDFVKQTELHDES